MAEEQILQLQLSDDLRSVVLKVLPPEVPLSLIHQELTFLNVTTGILQKQIEEALAQVAEGKVVQNLVVAQAGLHELEIGLIPQNKKISINDLQGFTAVLNRLNFLLLAHKSIADNDPEGKLKEHLCFIKEGQAIIRVSKKVKNVLGQEEEINPEHDLLDTESRIEIDDKGTYFEYLAKESGYLIFTDTQRLDILSPLRSNETKTELYCMVQPVSVGIEELEHVLKESADEKLLSENKLSIPDMLSSGFSDACIRKQVDVVEGKNAELRILVEKKELVADENDRVDYKSLSSFLHVDEKITIAKKIKAIEGKAGIDIWQNTIEVEPVSDAEFVIGDNILSEDCGEEIVYTSAVEGVLYVNGVNLNVSEGLIVEGDVDSKTGNIVYEKDVIIQGSLTEGFAIESAGNVSIQGSVGNHTRLDVKKNLEVIRGIFGEETTVYVKGNAEIGFVQESMVRVEGNCTIDRFLYQANVFAGGVLVVEGNKVKAQTKGAIIGGVSNGLLGIKAHSVGSMATKTELVVGVDLRLQAQLVELKDAAEATAKQVTNLEASVGMDLSKNDSVDHLKALGQKEKAAVKEKLVALKEAMERQKKIKTASEQLNEKLKSQSVPNAFIEISNKIIPDVRIRLGKSFREIRTEESNLTFRSSYNEILNEKDGKLYRSDGTLVPQAGGGESVRAPSKNSDISSVSTENKSE